MNKVLKLLLQGERLNTQQMAEILGISDAELDVELERLKAESILLGWRPILNPDIIDENQVRAVIELKISAERGVGYDRIAERVSHFEQVESCYLMSGNYDLLVVLSANNLKSVSSFVFEKLAAIDGVASTTTHFMLRAYKEQGYVMDSSTERDPKPIVS